jgi:hypothetical protein
MGLNLLTVEATPLIAHQQFSEAVVLRLAFAPSIVVLP